MYLAFLSLICESKNMILKLCWCRLSQRLLKATLANASEIARSASVLEMKHTISPQFSTLTLVLWSSVAACGTSGCEHCLMLSHLEGKLAPPYITLCLKVVGLGVFYLYSFTLLFCTLHVRKTSSSLPFAFSSESSIS